MDSPKVGDVKKCDKCGEEKARYDRLPVAKVKEREPREEPGDQYAWSCPACGFEDRVPS